MPNRGARIADRSVARTPATGAFLPPTPGSGIFRSGENVPFEMRSPAYRLSTEGTIAKDLSGAMHGHRMPHGMKRFGNGTGEAVAVGRRRDAMRGRRAHFVSRILPQGHARDTAGRPMQWHSPEFMPRFGPYHRKVIAPLIDGVRTR